MRNPSIIITAMAILGHPGHSTAQASSIKIPNGWTQTTAGTYEIRDLQVQRERAKTILASGHQPWRLESANIAAECLQKFGITVTQDLITFGQHLTVLQPKTMFQYSKQGLVYTVYIDMQSNIPIATKFIVTKQSARNA